jgi:hypothetical protein
MRVKTATILMLFAILAFDAWYLITAVTKGESSMVLIGPYYFPRILGVILGGLCVIKLIQTILKKDNKEFKVGNKGYILLTIVLTGALFLSWEIFGHFYIHAFIYLLLLFFLYRKEDRFHWKNIGINTATALGTTLIAYAVFEKLMKIYI